jgi:electron transfer flavoprotein alpha subunit
MGDVLAVAEQKDGRIRPGANEVVATAAAVAEGLGGSAHALVVGGSGVGEGAGALLGGFGAEVVHVGEDPALEGYVPESHAAVVANFVESHGYAAVLFAATTLGKDLAPRVAALVDAPLASDVTRLEVDGGKLVATRPVYGGKAIARVGFEAVPAVVTLRPNAFGTDGSRGEGRTETLTVVLPDDVRTRIVDFRAAESGSVDVAEASIIVSGGRGMKGPEHWGLLEDLRNALGSGAALGASRAVVDAGWRPHGEQVGQTGKTVAPKLYFAVGISGAVQHLAGMRTAQTIVAINKDPDAPIFSVADYGIVGDAFEVLPRLTAEIAALRSDG